MVKFSDRYIKSLKPKATRYEVLEGDGFTILAHTSGRKVFYYIYKLRGKNQRVKIGVYPAMPLSEARREHRALLDRRDRGEDLRRSNDVFTVKDLIDFYLKEWAEKRKKSWKEDERQLMKDIEPVWGNRPADEIKRGDVIRLLEDTLKRGTTVSNNLLKVMRRMYNFAIERDRLEVNPCYLIKPLGKETVKDRYLTENEIRTFWHSLSSSWINADIQKIMKLILVTGQRPGEVAGIHREEINGSWWTIPSTRTKNGRENRVWLSDLALSLMPDGKKHLFPSVGKFDSIQTNAVAKALRRAITGRERYKTETITINLAPFTPHDLRRTAATHMASLEVTAHVIGQILNHKEQTVTAIYNRYEYDNEKKQAMLKWESRLLDIVNRDTTDQ